MLEQGPAQHAGVEVREGCLRQASVADRWPTSPLRGRSVGFACSHQMLERAPAERGEGDLDLTAPDDAVRGLQEVERGGPVGRFDLLRTPDHLRRGLAHRRPIRSSYRRSANAYSSRSSALSSRILWTRRAGASSSSVVFDRRGPPGSRSNLFERSVKNSSNLGCRPKASSPSTAAWARSRRSRGVGDVGEHPVAW